MRPLRVPGLAAAVLGDGAQALGGQQRVGGGGVVGLDEELVELAVRVGRRAQVPLEVGEEVELPRAARSGS